MQTRGMHLEFDRLEETDRATSIAGPSASHCAVPSFEELFAEFQPLVYSIGLRYLGRPEDAEDITQEVFTKIWKNLDSFNYQSSLKTWIYRISVNACIDHGRKPWKKIGEQTTGIEDAIQLGEGQALVADDETAERRLIAKEKADQVRRAITCLKPHLKAVLVLKDLEELSYDEISSVLGLSMGTISSRLNRARRALLDLFQSAAQPLPQAS